MGAAFFLNSFAFLELKPRYKCMLENEAGKAFSSEAKWTFSTPENTLEDEYCSGEHTCEIDWDHN